MKHLSEEQLILLYYGESKRTEEERRHLGECDRCRDELATLEEILTNVAPDSVPERSAEYGREVWREIEARLAHRSILLQSWSTWFQPRRLVWAAVGVALVGAVFLVGRWSTRWGAAPEPSLAEVRERILLVAVGDHLESSQILLMELMNRPDASTSGESIPPTFDISYERQRAEDLLGQNRLYRQTATRAGDGRMASVLDELERLLIEIVHSPANADGSNLEELRRRIESEGVLFKVKVLTTNVRERQLESVKQKEL